MLISWNKRNLLTTAGDHQKTWHWPRRRDYGMEIARLSFNLWPHISTMAIILLCNNHLTSGTYWAYLFSVSWVGVSRSTLNLAYRVSGLLSQLGWHESLLSPGSHLFWADPSWFTSLSSFSWVSNLERTHFPHDSVKSTRITLRTFQALIL